jgi:heavy metal efflux system protein
MLALGGALVLAFTWVPTLCVLWLTGEGRSADGSRGSSEVASDYESPRDDTIVMAAIARGYRPLLDFALRRRVAIVAGAVALFAISAIVFSRLGGGGLPRLMPQARQDHHVPGRAGRDEGEQHGAPERFFGAFVL